MNIHGEELRSFHVDFEKRIFRINGINVSFCTEFELKGYVGREGPTMLLNLKMEPQFYHRCSEEELGDMQKPPNCE